MNRPKRHLLVAALAVLVLALVLPSGASALTFDVDTTADDNDGDCNGASGDCTLREAVIAANGAAGSDDIEFDVAGQITVGSNLPALAQTTNINGTTAPGYTGPDPVVEVDGNGGPTIGIELAGGSSSIQGLAINGFTSTQVRLTTANTNTLTGNYIGTDTTGAASTTNDDSAVGVSVESSANNVIGTSAGTGRNVISGVGIGVWVFTSGNSMVNNYIGTSDGGSTALPNGLGVRVSGASNTIGGPAAADANVISGNSSEGLSFEASTADGNEVYGNYIGLNAAGTAALANGIGIGVQQGDNNVIGAAGQGNVISGNTTTGIDIYNDSADGTLVRANSIGTDSTGVFSFSNGQDGVRIQNGADDSVIGGTGGGDGNRIANSGGNGVEVTGSALNQSLNNRVLGNSITNNVQLGMNLGATIADDGVTANDADDVDTGADLGNEGQNYPVLTSAEASGGSATVNGTLNAEPSTQYRVEVFRNTACDASGNGEGQTFVTFQNVTTDTGGDATFSIPATGVINGDQVTATATDSASPTPAGTSEFSACVAATGPFVVTDDGDAGDGTCDSSCTLRDAIDDANAAPGADEIDFDIAGDTIAPTSPLPTITGPVTIDGSSDPDFAPPTRPVVLSGASAGPGVDGLVFDSGSSGSTVSYLAINGFAGGNGILVDDEDITLRGNFIGTNAQGTAAVANNRGIETDEDEAIIGGSEGGMGNVISGNTTEGIRLEGGSNELYGNFVGTDRTGLADVGNGQDGLVMSELSPNNTVGGAGDGERNVISGNDGFGLNADAGDNSTIRGNYVGVGSDGSTDVGNLNGIAFQFGGDDNTIGGDGAGEGNVISGNDSDGVFIAGNSISNDFRGNRIGTNAAGNAARPNGSDGVDIAEGSDNEIINNTIANSGDQGVKVVQGESNAIRFNSIFENGGQGIDLNDNGTVQPNDADDPDAGPNDLQNYPVLTSGTVSGTTATVQGTLNSTPNTTFDVEVYKNTTCDGTHGEGGAFGATESVTTNANGDASFQMPVALVEVGQRMTATATPSTGLDSGSTSEFSQCRTLVAAPTGGGGAQPANLTTSLSASPQKVEPGNPLTLTGTVKNNGPGAAPGATLTFAYPSSADFRSASPGCSPAGAGTVTCSLGTLGNGASAQRQVVVIPRREGEFRSSARAASSTSDPSPGDSASTSAVTAALPTPQTRRSFNASVKRGTVTVKCPGDRRFNQIEGDVDLSFRCLVDTRKGQLQITTTAGGGKLQSALFYEGIFKAGQTRGRRPVTELRLAGKLQTGRWARGSKKNTAEQARRRRRRLWGRGRGRFRTRGRRGSASVRGTTWLVEDRNNNTTFFKVTQGRVTVRDFGRRRNVNLGGRGRKRSYTARPRRRR